MCQDGIYIQLVWRWVASLQSGFHNRIIVQTVESLSNKSTPTNNKAKIFEAHSLDLPHHDLKWVQTNEKGSLKKEVPQSCTWKIRSGSSHSCWPLKIDNYIPCLQAISLNFLEQSNEGVGSMVSGLEHLKKLPFIWLLTVRQTLLSIYRWGAFPYYWLTSHSSMWLACSYLFSQDCEWFVSWEAMYVCIVDRGSWLSWNLTFLISERQEWSSLPDRIAIIHYLTQVNK